MSWGPTGPGEWVKVTEEVLEQLTFPCWGKYRKESKAFCWITGDDLNGFVRKWGNGSFDPLWVKGGLIGEYVWVPAAVPFSTPTPTVYTDAMLDGLKVIPAWEHLFGTLTTLSALIYEANKSRGWHPSDRRPGEFIALIHSELSEALEAVRKDKMDDHLPEYPGEAVELGDAIIRILDYCQVRGYNIGEIVAKKVRYNLSRQDHSPEARAAEGGKKL